MPSWKVTNRASITNQPAWTVGGLGPTVGKGPFASNAIQINANGQGPFRFRTFCPNQLGNIGGGLNNSMFSPSADGTNGCRDQPNVNPPYGINSGGPSICDTSKALSGTFTYIVKVGESVGVPSPGPPPLCYDYKGFLASSIPGIVGPPSPMGSLNRYYLFNPNIIVQTMAYEYPKLTAVTTCGLQPASLDHYYIIVLTGCITQAQVEKSKWKFKFSDTLTHKEVHHPGVGEWFSDGPFIYLSINLNNYPTIRTITEKNPGEEYSLEITATPQ